MKKEISPAVTIAIIVVVALLAGYFLFMRSDTGSVKGNVAQSKNAKKDDTVTMPTQDGVAK